LKINNILYFWPMMSLLARVVKLILSYARKIERSRS
jgi:hypothetical protein